MSSLTLDVVAKALFGAKVAHDSKSIGTEIATVMERFLSQATLSFLLPERDSLAQRAATAAIAPAI